MLKNICPPTNSNAAYTNGDAQWEKSKVSISPGCHRKIPLNPPLQKGEAPRMPGLISYLAKKINNWSFWKTFWHWDFGFDLIFGFCHLSFIIGHHKSLSNTHSRARTIQLLRGGLRGQLILLFHLFPFIILCWTFGVRCSSFSVPPGKNNLTLMQGLPAGVSGTKTWPRSGRRWYARCPTMQQQ